MGFVSNNVAKNTVENFLNAHKDIVLENKEKALLIKIVEKEAIEPAMKAGHRFGMHDNIAVNTMSICDLCNAYNLKNQNYASKSLMYKIDTIGYQDSLKMRPEIMTWNMKNHIAMSPAELGQFAILLSDVHPKAVMEMDMLDMQKLLSNKTFSQTQIDNLPFIESVYSKLNLSAPVVEQIQIPMYDVPNSSAMQKGFSDTLSLQEYGPALEVAKTIMPYSSFRMQEQFAKTLCFYNEHFEDKLPITERAYQCNGPTELINQVEQCMHDMRPQYRALYEERIINEDPNVRQAAYWYSDKETDCLLGADICRLAKGELQKMQGDLNKCCQSAQAFANNQPKINSPVQSQNLSI